MGSDGCGPGDSTFHYLQELVPENYVNVKRLYFSTSITISLNLVSTVCLVGAKIFYKLLARIALHILRLRFLRQHGFNLVIRNNRKQNLDKIGYIFEVARCIKQ